MLNPFPTLLYLTFFAPTLLRIAAAVVFFYLAYHTLRRKDAIAAARFPLGLTGSWIVWLAVLAELLIAVCLFAGLYTQWAAILAALGALKALAYRRLWPELSLLVFPISSGTSFLLLVISLSLIITGAGAFAFDIPL